MKKLLILLLLICLTGCWNYRELNEYAIVTGLAIDYTDNMYEVSLLFANGKKSETEENQITVSSDKGNTIYEAINNIGLSTPKEIYISHLSVVIISEEVARLGVQPILDYLLREPQSHENFYIIIAKDTEAKNTLSVLAPQSDYPSQNITSSIKVNEQLQGRITNASFNEFVSKLLQKGFNPISNSIVIIGNEEKGTKKLEQENSKVSAYTKLDKIAIFKEDKLVDYASTDEGIGINMLLGNIKSLYLTVPYNDNNIVIKITKYNIKNNVKKDTINIDIDTEGIINEVGCKIDLNDSNNIHNLEEKAKEELKIYSEEAIKKAKELNTDIFGYGNKIYKKYPKYFNNIDNWDKEFNKLNINITTNLKIKNKGSTEQSIGELSYE